MVDFTSGEEVTIYFLSNETKFEKKSSDLNNNKFDS